MVLFLQASHFILHGMRTTPKKKGFGDALSHYFFREYNNKKMGTLQFHIPGFQNDPSYPKQKEFLKSYEGNLK